jgi:cyanoexosortase A
MKINSFSQIRSLSGFQFWLLAIAAALVTVHLTLVKQHGNSSFFALSLLFWSAVTSVVWQDRSKLNFKSPLFSRLLGLLLIGVVLVWSLVALTLPFLEVYPFLAALGLGLFASGLKGLKQYQSELIILFFWGVPKALLYPVLDLSSITTQFSTFILWYTGHDVVTQGTIIALPGGAVTVLKSCSGLNGVFYMLGLSVMALTLYPVQGRKRWLIPIIAMLTSFIINSFRVVILVRLADAQQQAALHYWHEGKGSLIFLMIPVILFGFFYLFLLQRETLIEQDDFEPESS